MISYYDGTPGSGKSYHAVRTIIKKLQAGVNVITDIAIDFSGYTKRKGKKSKYVVSPLRYKGQYIHAPTLTVPMLYEFCQAHTDWNVYNEHQHLCVIDEVYNYFDPREFNAEDRKLWIAFLKISRHMRMDFILIGQHGKTDIDKKIMSCVDNAFIHRSLIKLQWAFQILCLLTGKWFVVIQWGCKKGVPVIKLDVSWVHLDPKWAGRYDSHHLFMDSSFAKMLTEWYKKHPEQFSGAFVSELPQEENKEKRGEEDVGSDKQQLNEFFSQLIGEYGDCLEQSDFEFDNGIFDNK